MIYWSTGLTLAYFAKYAKISYSYTPNSMHLALQQGRNLSKLILLGFFDVTWYILSGCLGLVAYGISIGLLSKIC